MSAALLSGASRQRGDGSGAHGRRVVHLTAHYDPYVGGVEHVVDRLARGQASRGAHVTVLTTDVGAGDAAPRERRGRVEVRRCRSFRIGQTPVSVALLAELLRQPRGSIVHVHGPHAYVPEIARLAAWVRAFVLVAHVHLDVEASGPLGRLLPVYKRLLLGPLLRRAARVVVLTESMAEQVRRRYSVDRTRIGVIANGVDPEFFAVGSRPAIRDGEPLRLLSVGRLVPQKNVARLIRAMGLVESDVRLVVAGDGEERASLESLAAALGLGDDRVRFVGNADHEAVRDWMGWADAFVSSSNREGMPLTFLEAMASGLPVVATDVEGSRELIGEDGLLVPASPKGLAAGIDQMARRSAMRTELAERGRGKARRHRWPEVCGRLDEEYEIACQS